MFAPRLGYNTAKQRSVNRCRQT